MAWNGISLLFILPKAASKAEVGLSVDLPPGVKACRMALTTWLESSSLLNLA